MQRNQNAIGPSRIETLVETARKAASRRSATRRKSLATLQAIVVASGSLLAGMAWPQSALAVTINSTFTNSLGTNVWGTAGNWNPAAVPNDGTPAGTNYTATIP